MNTKPKKAEAPFAAASPLADNDELSEPNLPVRQIKLTPEGINQADVDAVLKRLAAMRKRLYTDIIFIGGHLAKMRAKIPHGRWGHFISGNFPLSIKTANIWIRAWEGRNSEFALEDPDSYMRDLWGNEPKKLKASSSREESRDDDDDDDDEQSGGEGFGAGLGEPTIFADKGKVGFFGYKNLVAMLDRDFFGSKGVTREAKLEFITELTNWLETKKKNLGA